MATNINVSRKPNLGLSEYSGFPIAAPADYMAMAKDVTSAFPLPLSSNQMSHNNEGPLMPPTAHSPFSTNHFGHQTGSSFGIPSRQYENSLEMARQKYNPLANPNMPYISGPYSQSNATASEQFPINRFPMKYRNPEIVNKSLEQGNYTQQQRSITSSPWAAEYLTRNQRLLTGKASRDQGLAEPAVNQNMNIDQPFTNHGNGGSGPYPMQSRYVSGEMYKQAHMNDQQFAARGMGSNFHPQDYYQQEQMRQIANAQQYQPTQGPHPGHNFMAATRGNSPASFSQSVITKGSQESMFPQYGTSPKANGPHPMMNMHSTNMVDRGQVPFHNPNYPVSPVGSQIAAKPNYGSTLGMRGTVSPNVTIGLPKKQFQPQEEGVISPSGNQNAAAAAAAAAVLAAINTANSHTSPQPTGDIHSVPSRPPSIHTKDGGSRSPATSISDHKSESGGSGINDLGTAPSPAKSLTQSSPRVSAPSSVAPFSSEIATGRVPSPSVNQLPSSDIEAMIHSVSNISGIASSEPSSTTSQRSKRESKPAALPNLNAGSNLSPVTPPSPFSLSPSITDFELDILSPSWDDSAAGSTTLVSKLYKLSDEPERKVFLDRLVLLSEHQGKGLGDVPNYNGAVLDLYKFYKLVIDRGGFQEVIRLKLWKEVVQGLTNTSEPNPVDSQSLRDHYMRFLLPFESRLNGSVPFSSSGTTPFPPSAATTRASVVSSAGSFPNHSTASPSNPQLGSIDLSSMNYKNLSMFQSAGSAPSFGQGLPNVPNQPPAYPSAPSTPQPQNFPGSSPMSHQMASYRNVPQHPPSLPGYHGLPSASQRVPGYPGSSSPGYPSHQMSGYAGPSSSSQMPGYHNSLGHQVPGYRGAGSTVPPEALYLREQHGEFSRGSPHGMNNPYQNVPDSQHPSMYSNFPQQSQHPPGMMFSQQHSNHPSHYPLSKRRFGPRSSGGTASPEQRMQAFQNQWGHKYPSGTTLSDPGSAGHSPFHPSQSAKMTGIRPPPPYPHAKLEKSSPLSNSATTTPSQHMRMGVHGSPRSDELLFPSGCVESTKPLFARKRRLTARDIGAVEAWRVMMSLKSGLLSETTWALDTLTILLCDDSTVGFFRLAHLPGLLDTVVEHFRRNLINVFGILDESEVETGVPKQFSYGNTTSDENDMSYSEKIPHLLAEENFSALIVADCLDEEEKVCFSSGSKDWSHGGGDTTIHIQTHFETDPEFYQERVSKDHTEPENGDNTEISSCKTPTDVLFGVVATDDQLEEEKEVDGAPVGNDVQRQVKQEHKVGTSCKGDILCYNGVTSPKRTKRKAKSINVQSDIRKGVNRQETRFDIKAKICCNGEDGVINERKDYPCATIKVESNMEDPVKDPSASLIKRLKTELDLDVDCLSDDADDVTSSRTCRVSTTDHSEVECELRQEFPLSSLTSSQDSAIKCCICVSNIIRSLSFVPRNDVEMARHPSLLLILGKLFLLHHLQKRKGHQGPGDGQHSDKYCWWNDCLEVVRENALVTVANIAGYLDLSLLTDTVSYPLLDGLLHWLVCQSTAAVDSFQSASGGGMSLSPKHLALETLAKMSVLESNVDFILMSPDKTELAKAYEYLVKLFSDKANEVTREFSLVLLSSLTQSDETTSSSCSEINLITVLVGFLEDATESVEAMAARGLHLGIFHDDDMHVSVGMLRRAAGLLSCIAKKTNSDHLIPFQERILTLSMSHLLDIEVQAQLSNVLYNLPR